MAHITLYTEVATDMLADSYVNVLTVVIWKMHSMTVIIVMANFSYK